MNRVGVHGIHLAESHRSPSIVSPFYDNCFLQSLDMGKFHSTKDSGAVFRTTLLRYSRYLFAIDVYSVIPKLMHHLSRLHPRCWESMHASHYSSNASIPSLAQRMIGIDRFQRCSHRNVERLDRYQDLTQTYISASIWLSVVSHQPPNPALMLPSEALATLLPYGRRRRELWISQKWSGLMCEIRGMPAHALTECVSFDV